jgi:hypothetical protein
MARWLRVGAGRGAGTHRTARILKRTCAAAPALARRPL